MREEDRVWRRSSMARDPNGTTRSVRPRYSSPPPEQPSTSSGNQFHSSQPRYSLSPCFMPTPPSYRPATSPSFMPTPPSYRPATSVGNTGQTSQWGGGTSATRSGSRGDGKKNNRPSLKLFESQGVKMKKIAEAEAKAKAAKSDRASISSGMPVPPPPPPPPIPRWNRPLLSEIGDKVLEVGIQYEIRNEVHSSPDCAIFSGFMMKSSWEVVPRSAICIIALPADALWDFNYWAAMCSVNMKTYCANLYYAERKGKTIYFITEEFTNTVDTWLKAKHAQWTSSSDSSLSAAGSWWDFIKRDVQKLLRNVVRAMWALMEDQKFHGNLKSAYSVLLKKDMTAKLIPIISKQVQTNDSVLVSELYNDIVDIQNLIYKIFAFPFRSSEEKDIKSTMSKLLPSDLLLDINHTMKMYLAREGYTCPVKALKFLMDFPSLWTSEEALQFIHNFHEGMELGKTSYRFIKEYMPRTWVHDARKEPTLNKLLDHLGYTPRDRKTKGSAETYYTERPSVFLRNAGSHYKDATDQRQPPDRYEVEGIIRSNVKNIYHDLKLALFRNMTEGYLSKENLKWFLDNCCVLQLPTDELVRKGFI